MSRRSPLSLMELHVQSLFTHDASDRLLAVNDGAGGAPPRFFLGRTEEGCCWRFSADLPASIAERLEAACADEPPRRPGDPDLPRARQRYVEILAATEEVRTEWAGPCYAQPADAAHAAGAADGDGIQLIDESNADLLDAHLPDWKDVALRWQPMVVTVHQGAAVSVCAAVRRSDAALEAGVETVPEFRRRGFGRHAVRRWIAEVRRIGLEPLYSTSWQNEASQHLALSLGLEMFGVDFHVR